MVVIVVSDYSFSVFKDALMQEFSSPLQFSDSIASRLLDRFSLAFLFTPYGPQEVPPAILKDYRRSVQVVLPLLRALAATGLEGSAIDEDESTSPSSPTLRRAQKKRQPSRRTSRASIRSAHSPVIESKPFLDYGVKVPYTAAEASMTAERVLKEQKDILEVSSSVICLSLDSLVAPVLPERLP